MPKLIVAIVTDMQVCHDVIRLWETLKVPGATILDSMGMRHLQQRQAHRDDLRRPIFPGDHPPLRGLPEGDGGIQPACT